MNAKLKKLLTTPNLYFYDYFAKRVLGAGKGYLDTKPLPTFIHRLSQGPMACRVLQSLVSILDKSKIAYFFGGDDDNVAATVHLESSYIHSLLGHIRAISTQTPCELYIALPDGGVLPLARADAAVTLGRGHFDILCVENTSHSSIGRTIATSVIHVILWHEEKTYSKERIMLCRKANNLVARVRRKTFTEYGDAHVNIWNKLAYRHSAQATFPIDVVYTWVNGDDPSWIEKKQKFQPSSPTSEISRATHDERFRNNDELRYSLRSVEMFAPFVNRIFLVVDGHVPPWLDRAHPRLTVVEHKDIYNDPNALPSFNSNSIESQLHHIPLLAEHFLYFNDDMFLGALCRPEDFFLGNGMMRCFPSDQRVHGPDIDITREEYIIAERNMLQVLEEEHQVVATEIMLHVPYPSLKSYLQELEARYKNHFDECARQRFRSPKDIRAIPGAQYHFGFVERRCVPSRISHQYFAMWKPHIGTQLQNMLRSRNCKTFCINDVGVAPDEALQKRQVMLDFLQAYFPFRSSFELSD